MKRKLAVICFLFLIAGPVFAQETANTSTAQQPPPTPASFDVNYFGFRIRVICQVSPSSLPEGKLQELVQKDTQEISDCLLPIRNVFDRYQMKGYAQILFLSRFVQSIPATSAPGPSVSLSDAVVGKKELNHDNQIVLLYSLIAANGYTSMIYALADKGNMLLLQVLQPMTGVYVGNSFYVWDPDKGFTDPPFAPGKFSFSAKLVNSGKPITFEALPDIPWISTAQGEAVSFGAQPAARRPGTSA